MFDGQGSERTVTNASQSVTGTLTSSAFGQTVATTGNSTSAYQYAATSGYRNDGDAGLTHVGARYYDAQVGRFISRDTYLDQKPYLYCEHDPVNATDPSGHETITEKTIRMAQGTNPPSSDPDNPTIPGPPDLPGPIQKHWPTPGGGDIGIGYDPFSGTGGVNWTQPVGGGKIQPTFGVGYNTDGEWGPGFDLTWKGHLW